MESIQNKKNSMNAIKRFFVGLLIGIGGILPGVSGGVMAVVFGLYRPMLAAVETFFKDIKNNALFLLPLGLGGGIGILSGALVLNTLLDKYEVQIMFLFIGLVVGGIPGFIEEANSQNQFKLRYLIATVFGALIAGLLAFLDNSSQGLDAVGDKELTLIQGLISGIILAVGTIVPGISTSFILMYLGWYEPILAAVSNIDILILLMVALGALASGLIFIKLVRILFNNVGGYAYYAVLGFLCVSVILIFPGFNNSFLQIIICVVLAALGFFTTLFSGRSFKQKQKQED